jgi:hypothetical protein
MIRAKRKTIIQGVGLAESAEESIRDPRGKRILFAFLEVIASTANAIYVIMYGIVLAEHRAVVDEKGG